MTQVRLALEVGFKGSDIFLNGCGKQTWELELAIDNGCFLNVDSGFDAENICRLADLKQKIVQVDKNAWTTFFLGWTQMFRYLHFPKKVLVRLNPSLPVSVHPYLATGAEESKFGVREKKLVLLAINCFTERPAIKSNN